MKPHTHQCPRCLDDARCAGSGDIRNLCEFDPLTRHGVVLLCEACARELALGEAKVRGLP